MRTSLALFLALPCAVLAQADLDRSLFIRLSASLVKVEAVSADGHVQLGTGVTVAPSRVATNCHVTRHGERVSVTRGGMVRRARAQLADIEHDICLLDTPGLEMQPVRLGSAQALQVGQPVAALGFEGGVGLQYRQGLVNALHLLDGGKVVQATTAFTSGASGGGLFDAQGRLVGLLTFRLRGADASYFAVPVEWFAAAVRQDSSYAAMEPLGGARKPFWQRPQRELPFFMQANSLRVDQRWVDLLGLTERWAEREKVNAEPWYMRGEALVGLERSQAALKAYATALALDPGYASALLSMGEIHLREGRLEEARTLEAKLRGINASLADRLAQTIAHRPRAPAPKI